MDSLQKMIYHLFQIIINMNIKTVLKLMK